MSIVLFRVDERLIHGQVVVGWGARLHPNRIVVVDDELAESPWEQELYRMGVPPEVDASFASVETARDELEAWESSSDRVVVLTRDVRTMSRLARDGGLDGREVNIGGIHHGPGRTRVLRYVFLSDAERDELQDIARQGARVVARDVPGARGVELDDLVGGS